MMKDKKLWLFAFVVYIQTVGIYYILFTNTPLGGSLASPVAPPSVGTNGQLVFDESLPKTQACPMNGELYSKQQESWWQKHRPL